MGLSRVRQQYTIEALPIKTITQNICFGGIRPKSGFTSCVPRMAKILLYLAQV